MIKRLVSFTLHLLILLLSFSAFGYLFLTWTGYFDNTTLVGYLYHNTAFQLVEIDQMTEQFAAEEIPFESMPIYGSVTERAEQMIEKGANTLILNLDESPTDDLIALAAEYSVTLFFVGALPTETQCESYDKLWCFTESSAYAGELLGEQVASGFRDGSIADQNEDLLLDYVFFNKDETYMEPTLAVDATILELDHYGVYTTDTYAAAYSVALAAAELAAETAAAEAAAAAEAQAAETTETDLNTQEETENTLDTIFDPSSVTITLAELAMPEVALSIGSANASYLANQSIALGWRSGETPTILGCIVENYATAQTLANTGLYDSIVYFDTTNATKAIVAMACNAWAQTPVTNGTDYAEPEDKIFVLPHALYNTK